MAARLRHLRGHLAPAASEQPREDVSAEQDEVGSAASTPFPLFGPSSAVDDAFVARFVTEGFAAIVPDTPDGAEARAATIHAALHGFVPPIVRSEEEAAELGFDEFMVANEETEGRPMHPESKENYYKDNSTPILPELDETVDAPNVKAALAALLGRNYMLDSTRGAHYTIPNRHTKQDFHRGTCSRSLCLCDASSSERSLKKRAAQMAATSGATTSRAC